MDKSFVNLSQLSVVQDEEADCVPELRPYAEWEVEYQTMFRNVDFEQTLNQLGLIRAADEVIKKNWREASDKKEPRRESTLPWEKRNLVFDAFIKTIGARLNLTTTVLHSSVAQQSPLVEVINLSEALDKFSAWLSRYRTQHVAKQWGPVLSRGRTVKEVWPTDEQSVFYHTASGVLHYYRARFTGDSKDMRLAMDFFKYAFKVVMPKAGVPGALPPSHPTTLRFANHFGTCLAAQEQKVPAMNFTANAIAGALSVVSDVSENGETGVAYKDR